jgi:galactan beta-1,4-galactosyltransferase
MAIKFKEKKLFLWSSRNYAAEHKLFCTTLLLLCTIATLFCFIPSSFTISASDLRLCISRISQTPPTPTATPPPAPSSINVHEKLITNSNTTIIKRLFNPYGSAAYNFITMSAYRGGLNTFAINGLSSKPLHVYGNPSYECEWIPNTKTNSSENITTIGYKMLPDWGYGRVYTVVIVNCTFNEPINVDNNGGKLMLYASTSGGGDTKFNVTDRMEVLVEQPKVLDITLFDSKPKLDYFYCGSSLFGNLNPQRVREWIAYHVKLFGPNSHFVLHDAGGVHEEVFEVLKPWIELGYVTLNDIRDQERFDGYYHNQVMVLNDCLHKYKFMAKWMFFFDVDEYIYVPPKSTIKTVLDSLSEYSQFTIEQMAMSVKVCLSHDYGKTYRYIFQFLHLVYSPFVLLILD